MASWTDNQRRQYNDYIGAPVDAYIAVGMQKQQQYDSGVAQVQNYISNIAGLDIYRDVDKQYLQNKVDSIVSELNNISGADWSNKSLVNRATSYAGSITKDEKVINAAYSTMSIKALEQSRKELKEKHPELYPIEAEDFDNEQLQGYLNNTEAGIKYNGPKEATRLYNPDNDIQKALKDLEPSIVTNILPNGKYSYTYDKNTKITPAQIDAVVNGVINSNPEYSKALQLKARYQYKNYTGSDFARLIEQQNNNQIQNYRNTINDYQSKIDADPNNYEQNTIRKEAIAQAETKIAELQTSSLEARSSQNNPIRLANLKQAAYKQEYVNRYINNFQKDNHEVELKENIEATKTDEMKLKWLTAGLDPSTQLPIQPGSPYYDWNKRSSKSSNGTPSLSETPISIGANATKTGESQVNDIINGLDNQRLQLDTDFRNQWKAKYDKDDNAYDAWQRNNQSKLANGENVDNDYVAYQQSINTIQQKQNAYGNLKRAAEDYVQREFPTSDIGVRRIDGLSFAVDYRGQNDFVNLLRQVRQDAITSLENKGTRLGKDVAGLNDFAISEESKNIIDNYRSNPNFKYLKEVVDKGFTNYSDRILEPLDNKLKEQSKAREEYYKNNQSTFYPKALTISNTGDDYKRYISLAQNAYTAEFESIDEVDNKEALKDIRPQAIYRNTVTGDVMIRYQLGDKGKLRDSKVQLANDSDIQSLLPTSKYDALEQSITVDPSHKSAPILTPNGKFNYKIGHNSYSGYYVQLYTNGQWISLPTPYNSAGEAKESLDKASTNIILQGLNPAQAQQKLLQILNNNR